MVSKTWTMRKTMKFSVVDTEYPLVRIWEEFLLKNIISSLTQYSLLEFSSV